MFHFYRERKWDLDRVQSLNFSCTADMPYNDRCSDCFSSLYKHCHLKTWIKSPRLKLLSFYSKLPRTLVRIMFILNFQEAFRAVSKDIPSFVSTVNAFPVIVICRGESCGSGLLPSCPRVALPQLQTEPSEKPFETRLTMKRRWYSNLNK